MSGSDSDGEDLRDEAASRRKRRASDDVHDLRMQLINARADLRVKNEQLNSANVQLDRAHGDIRVKDEQLATMVTQLATMATQLATMATQHQTQLEEKEAKLERMRELHKQELERMRELHKQELERIRDQHRQEIADKDKQLNGFIDAINRNTNTLTKLASGIFSLKNAVVGAGNQLNGNVLKLSNDIKGMGSATKMIADVAEESGREMTVALANVTKHATTRRDGQTHGTAVLFETTADRSVINVMAGLEDSVKGEADRLRDDGYDIYREFQPVPNPVDVIVNMEDRIEEHNNELRHMNARTNEVIQWREVTKPDQDHTTLKLLLPATASLSNALDLYTRAENETRVQERPFNFSAIDDRLADVDTLRSELNAQVQDLQLEHNTTADATAEMADQLAQLALDCLAQQPALPPQKIAKLP